MKQYSKNYEIKNRAKDYLQGRYKAAVLLCFLNVLIPEAARSFINILLAPFIPAVNLENGISAAAFLPAFASDAVIQIIASSVLGVFQAGCTLFFLNMACGQAYSVSDLFYGFRHDFGKFLTISAMHALLSVLCLLPGQDLLLICRITRTFDYMLPAAAATLLGLAIYVPLSLGLALSYCLMLDFPNKSPYEVIALSFRIMHGSKRRLLMLELGFIPLMLLCICTLYVGFLWLMPYMQMNIVCFFLDIMNPREVS